MSHLTLQEGAPMLGPSQRTLARAEEIIADSIGDDCLADLAAQNLALEGILLPDLPRPHAFTPDTDPEWAQNYLEEWEWVPDVQFYSTTSTFYLNVKDGATDGGFEFSQEEWLNMRPVQLREIAAILLAAADYQEKGTTNE